MIIVSGSRPTGKLHLGHYFTIKNWINCQDQGHSCYFFIANWHGLTTHKEYINTIYSSTFDIAKTYLAMGVNPDKSTIFIQSEIKEHAELFLIFNMLATVSRLERIPTYKSQQENLDDEYDTSSAGFLTYPVLQAADILLYKGQGVPVGEDQVCHVELTREIARKFNSLYGNIFPEPESIISEVPSFPGTDGRKMSKSYGNSIEIDINDEELGKKIYPMMTDPARKRKTDCGNPDICPVFQYHKAFTQNSDETDYIIDGCKTAKIGCIECKKILHKNISSALIPVWNNMKNIKDTDVKNVLNEGNKKARKIAVNTMEEVNKNMKFIY